jgi:hypothetical protein
MQEGTTSPEHCTMQATKVKHSFSIYTHMQLMTDLNAQKYCIF